MPSLGEVLCQMFASDNTRKSSSWEDSSHFPIWLLTLILTTVQFA